MWFDFTLIYWDWLINSFELNEHGKPLRHCYLTTLLGPSSLKKKQKRLTSKTLEIKKAHYLVHHVVYILNTINYEDAETWLDFCTVTGLQGPSYIEIGPKSSMVWTAGREDEFSGFSQLNESSVIRSDLYPCLLLFEWVNTYIE